MKMNFLVAKSTVEENVESKFSGETTEGSLVGKSPFDAYVNNPATSFAVYIEPFRNTYYKTYQNILTLSALPAGPLAEMVQRIHPPKLSEFQPHTQSIDQCRYALMRYPRQSRHHTTKNERAYMGASDLPAVYGYLKANGYHIDTRLTKMSFQSSVNVGVDEHEYSGNRRLVCMVDFRNFPYFEV